MDQSVQKCNRGIITNSDMPDICPDVRADLNIEVVKIYILKKVCCLDCGTPECKVEEDEWKMEDTECAAVGGVCQFNSLSKRFF